jgi:hypothetical protein
MQLKRTRIWWEDFNMAGLFGARAAGEVSLVESSSWRVYGRYARSAFLVV